MNLNRNFTKSIMGIFTRRDKDGYDEDGYDKEHCPNCNSSNHSMIIWGLPDSIAMEDHREREDNVIFGGCCVPGNNPPDTSCNDCGHQW